MKFRFRRNGYALLPFAYQKRACIQADFSNSSRNTAHVIALHIPAETLVGWHDKLPTREMRHRRANW